MQQRAERHGSDLAPPEEERAVIRRLQQGDRAAAGELYGWYGDRIYRQVVLPRLPELDAANDVLADTFVTALSKIASFRFEGVSIFFWLRRIAIHKVIDHYRRQGRYVELPDQLADDAVDPDAHHEPGESLDAEDTRAMVETSLSRMNPRYAEVLRMRLIEETPREACAEKLGITVGNLDVLLHRAAKAFRKVFPP